MATKRKWRVLLWLILSLLVLAILAWWLLLRPVPQPKTNDPIAKFNHGSIGNEAAQGLPYWIWRVLPTIFPDYLPGNKDGYGSLGFFWEPGSELPVGFTKKTLGVIPRVAFNCAFCHQGSYRLVGDTKSTLVPGGAGTRIQPQNYQRFLINAAKDPRFNADRIMTEIDRLYDMRWWEKAIYRYLLIPFTRRAIGKTAELFAWMDTKPDWGTGRIDPFNPVKFNQLKLPVDYTIGNSDMMPLLGFEQIVNRNKVYSLHWDGLNTDLHEVAVSGALGDGMPYKEFRRLGDHIKFIEDFARLQLPPPSPFSHHLPSSDPYYVSASQVEEGKAIHEVQCAECHTPSGSRFRTVIPILEVGTDRHRADMWNQWSKDRYSNYELGGPNWGFEHFQDVDGYVATEHTGLWLKGPYLHNGSVPTLRALLESPYSRPKRFCRGLDTADPENGGFIATVAQSKADCEDLFFYDTSVPGNGNVGHEFGTDLSPSQKEALLSYLKKL